MAKDQHMDVTEDSSALSVEQVRRRFRASGVSVTDWARKHGFSRQVVYSLLSGRTRGYRGISHSAAVALGLKVELDILELGPISTSQGESSADSHNNSPKPLKDLV